jgi:para-nitrobenzyl esterase
MPSTPAEDSLSEAMRAYWSSFARGGAPHAADQPAWRQHAVGGTYMHFAAAPAAANDLFPGMYRLHEEAVRRRRAAGDIAWNWNVGVASPPLPPRTPKERAPADTPLSRTIDADPESRGAP